MEVAARLPHQPGHTQRLERKKWIESERAVSENNQKVKSYQLTATGKKQLAAERFN